MATITPSATGGNWSANAAWTGGVPPTAADDVVFHAGAGNITIDGTSGSPNLCRSLDLATFLYAGTLTQGLSKQLNIGDGSGGSLKLAAGATYAPNATSVIKFVSTTSGNQITTAGKAMGNLTFDGVGGAWQFQDNCDNTADVTITLTNGTLDTNGKAVGATNGVFFSSNNSNTRALTLGATTWTVPTGFGGTGWDIGTSTGMTLSAASSTIQNTANVTDTFNFGGLTYGTVTMTGLTTAKTVITGSSTFSTLTLSMGATTKTTTSGYSISGTQTVTGAFTANGNSTILRNFIYSTTLGTPATISAATVTVTHTDFRDITGAGAGSWNFSGLTTTANGDAGGNSGITFTAPKNCFMKVASSANWSANNWKTTSGGSTAIVPAMPLVHDNCKFDINSITAGGVTFTVDIPRIPDFTWNGVTNTPVFATGSSAYELYGGAILVSGMTHTGTGGCTFRGRGSYSLDGGGLTWNGSSSITIDSFNGTLTSLSNFAGPGTVILTSGNFAMGGFTFSTNALSINGGTWSGSGALTVSGAVTVAGGTLTLGGTLTMTGNLTISSGTLTMNFNQITGNNGCTINGGTLNLSHQVNGSNAINISSGTINDSGPLGELKGTTASFTGGTSVVRKMTLSSTFAMSSTADLTIPAGGSATWATSWTVTGATCSLKYGGQPTFSSGALNVAGGYIPSLEAL